MTHPKTQETLRAEMLSVVPNAQWGAFLTQTPENINWMFAVYSIEEAGVESVEDAVELLTYLLNTMNAHYAGPISIHEGWGGTEADSNQELITSKLEFDMRETPEFIEPLLYHAAVQLGWLDAEILNQD